jgi:hypothetical protein
MFFLSVVPREALGPPQGDLYLVMTVNEVMMLVRACVLLCVQGCFEYGNERAGRLQKSWADTSAVSLKEV